MYELSEAAVASADPERDLVRPAGLGGLGQVRFGYQPAPEEDPGLAEFLALSTGPRGRGRRLPSMDRARVLAMRWLGHGIRDAGRRLGLAPMSVVEVERRSTPDERRMGRRLSAAARQNLPVLQANTAINLTLVRMQQECDAPAPNPDRMALLADCLALQIAAFFTKCAHEDLLP